MPQRFMSTEEAAKALGIAPRRMYAMMASGEIKSWCINPSSQRKRYKTTMDALESWQAASMMMPERKKVQDWHIQRK